VWVRSTYLDMGEETVYKARMDMSILAEGMHPRICPTLGGKENEDPGNEKIRFFFASFNVVCWMCGEEIMVLFDQKEDVKSILDVLGVRFSFGRQQEVEDEEGAVHVGIVVLLAQPKLFELIVNYWLRSFGDGKYIIPDGDTVYVLRTHCREFGMKILYGRIFADGYKAYVATVANHLFVSSSSIRNSMIRENVFQSEDPETSDRNVGVDVEAPKLV